MITEKKKLLIEGVSRDMVPSEISQILVNRRRQRDIFFQEEAKDIKEFASTDQVVGVGQEDFERVGKGSIWKQRKRCTSNIR